MKKFAARAFCTLLVTGLSAYLGPAALGQVATGIPPLSSPSGGPFDTVNLGNLNVHFAIPVIHKAGRGVPFTYDLSYDSSVWYPVTANGTKNWQPVQNWGWRAETEAALGYSTYTTSQGSCPDSTGRTLYFDVFEFTSYHDAFGVSHPFSVSVDSDVTLHCYPSFRADTASGTTKDGSGLTLNARAFDTTASATVTTRYGKVMAAPVQTGTGAGTMTDANGNQITVNSSSQFFDTLSSTTAVLTVAGSAPNPVTFTYNAPTGTPNYTLNYKTYTVATNFGLSGTLEYPPTSVPLVDNIALPDGSKYSFTYETTPTTPSGGACSPLSGTYSNNCVTARILQVTLSTGGTITYGYSGGSNGILSDGSTAGLSRTLSPGGTWTYARSNVSGAHWQTTVTDPTTPTGNQTVIDFQKDTSTKVPTPNFYETQRQVYQGGSTLLATSITCYNANYASCATTAVSSPITRKDAYSQLPNGSTRLSEVVYNGSGLVTDDKEYDYGVSTGAAPGTAHLIRETVVTYASLGNNILNKPASVVIKDWSSGTAATLASSTYSYDQTTPTSTSGTPQHVSITGSRGNLTTATTSTSSTASLSKTFTYYDTGNPYVATDVNSAQTTYVYSSAANPYNSSLTASCGNSFATTINEPLSLSRSIQWNCTGGIAEQVTDENGNNVTSTYTDADFWRPASVQDQENNQTTISYIGQTAVEGALSFNGGKSVSDSRTTVDGFGRPILSQRLQAPGGTNYDTAETDYNNLGQPSRSTMPFSATAGTTNSTPPATTRTYDALGRVLTIADADGGTVSYTYTNNDVLQKVSGSQTFQKQFEYDGLGRLISVCEISTTLPNVGACGQNVSQTGYLTQYTYDALGHLLGVTENAQPNGTQQTRAFVYDMLGRMTSENNPESGTKNYFYDSDSTNGAMCGNGAYTSNGDLVKTTDAAGNCVMYYSDSLHRVTDVGNNNQNVSHCKRFRYDNSSGYSGSTKPTGLANTLGRLIEAATDYCYGTNDTLLTDEWFSYSPRGELTDVYESTPNSGGYYHTTASYWPTGTLETLSGIPGVPTIYYGTDVTGANFLDGEGRITHVTAASGMNPVTGVTYSTSSTTNPLGALTMVTFGSSDSDSFTYDPNTGRMKTYTFSVNGNTDAGTFTWNTNGTLQKLVINDQIPGTSDSQTCNYLYDDLSRLSSANCGALWAQDFTYDAFGDIKKTVPSGSSGLTFAPVYTATNQFYSIPGVSVKYDANGELLTDNLNTYTWDAYGKMLTVSTGSVTVTETSDALGRMVESYNGSAYTQFVYGPTGAKLAKYNGQTLVKAFVALPAGAKAIYTSSGLAHFRHSDWLGSSRLTSTASRTVYSSSAYAPFGEQYANSGSADASFTGQDQDTVSSLYDFPERRQSDSQGRWISPDPAGMAAVDFANPQTWNRYAYVANRPVSVVDPTGLKTCPEYVCGGGEMMDWFLGYGGGGMNCTADGVAASCGMVMAMLGPQTFPGDSSMGGAVQCPNNNCSPQYIRGQWQYFGAWGDGSSGYMPMSLAGFSTLDSANAFAMVTAAASKLRNPVDPTSLTGASAAAWNLLMALGVSPKDITIYQNDGGGFEAVLSAQGFTSLMAGLQSNLGDAFLHTPYTNGARDSNPTNSLHAVWFDPNVTDYVGGSGVYMQFHINADNPWQGSMWGHMLCVLFKAGC